MKPLCYGDARISSALVTMTAIMGVPHIFDGRNDELRGGPLKYVLEIDGRRYTAFQCDDKGEMVVSPITLMDFLFEDCQDEPLPVISVSWVEKMSRLTKPQSAAYW